MNLLLIVCLFLCTSCTLRPVYSNNYSPQELNQLSAIEIEPIDSIGGAEFCYYLSSILPKSTISTTKYLLKVKFTNKSLPLIIQKNSDVLREAVSQTIQYRLIDIITNQPVTSGTFRHITSYSTASSPYHSYIDNEKALEELAKQGAVEILERLILYFKQNSIKNEVLPITNYSAT
ncbi:hypothetical protein [Candidatus Tisiphia endosymbiont of Oplodontha viridula]|uniref:hypothetical protein n=1 Tax=Candidatus Tisiphia endosymbiont of Oplodontha viridula TaxID=3077925 RepID=UPI0035C8E876